MTILMLLDHLLYIDGFVSAEMKPIFILISRCVAPMFAYFAVQGIFHTRNLKKYCMRLILWAGIMFLGNKILNTIFKTNSGSIPESDQKYLFINNNILFTLALGVCFITLILKGKENEDTQSKIGLYLLSGICFIVGIWNEWGTVVLPFMAVTYFFRDKRLYRYVGYIIIEIIAILISYSEPFYFFVFPFILLYNNKRGPNNIFTKYFFYFFYPLHIWAIALINYFVMIKNWQ